MSLLKNIVCIVAGVCFINTASAQQNNCAQNKATLTGLAKTTVASLQEDDYDVQYVKLDIEAGNISTAITGHAYSMSKVVAPSMSQYVFELSNQLVIDSAKINGQLMAVSSNGFIQTITLPVSLPANSFFTTDIWYHGIPTGGTGFFSNGILHQTNTNPVVDVTHTVSAAIHSRDWWPCKQSLKDKIDSADVNIIAPAGLKVAGNGLLKSITPVGNSNRYEWQMRYPVDYYLISFAVAPYVEYSYYMHFSATGDSMLVQNFIYDDPSVLQNNQAQLDSIGLIIDYFSTLFGKYPFSKEKFGICQTPLGGGMENQTMVSVGSLETTLIAHELAHQWWGDNVTCGLLHDMWLNEGFASYAEQLFVENFRGAAAAMAYRGNVFNQVLSGSAGSVYVTDTTNEWRIYSSRLSYAKGASLAHMLRFYINSDNQYFQILRSYQQQFAYGTATTADLLNIANQVSGLSLDTFFAQWYMREGYPTYSAKWAQQANGDLVLKLIQTTSKPASVTVFKMPLEVKFTSPQGDTVIRIFNDHAMQYYTFNWSRTATGFSIDPNDHIVNKNGIITQDAGVLGIVGIEKNKLIISPNPAAAEWNVQNIPIGAELQLTDMNGRQLWKGIARDNEMKIPAKEYAPGTYLLNIVVGKNEAVSYRLLR